MTEHERNHLLRMVKHAEQVRRAKAMDQRRKVLSPSELAEAIREAKRKHPNDYPA